VVAGCGVDLVCVNRLDRWATFTDERLGRVFTKIEMAAIRVDTKWSSQRAAVFFATKEAFYKALSNALVKTGRLEQAIFFGQVCPLIYVQKNTWGIPELVVDWTGISKLVGFTCAWQVDCSYAHESEYAIAYVILS
jgi:phosphopantetheine--protein transferase-like protein